jgi:UDP-hydrolysing UDP-N-acetyl-D-glucosamine 2-epimerase
LRVIGVVTVGRSDYGIYLPLLRRIEQDPNLDLQLFVSGMHLSPEFGLTVQTIERDDFTIVERVEMLLSSDTPESIAKSMGLGTSGFAQAFARSRPDILFVLGDRFEMHAAALAALPFKIPLAHIHGGELTTGAMDDSLRHSITKLSHLHFVSTEEYARRVRQLGEEPWRIFKTGALSLDHLKSIKLQSCEELESEVGLCLKPPPLVITYHPVSLEYERTPEQVRELLDSLGEFDLPMVFTLPNADPSGRIVMEMIRGFVRDAPAAVLVENLGTEKYFSLMAASAAMVGNSSSGLIEAPSFELPVVNIGNRQKGRVRAGNVIDVGNSKSEIVHGIQKALDLGFKKTLRGLVNPYGEGAAAEMIVRFLEKTDVEGCLIPKSFADLSTSEKEGVR